jgi:hypothetical protein
LADSWVFLGFERSEAVTVDTRFYSLKYSNTSFANVDEFWEAHSQCNSIEEDSSDRPSLLFDRKRIFMKMCKDTGSIVSRVKYRNRDAYLSHSQFLARKYGLKVVENGASELVFSSNELMAVDKIS